MCARTLSILITSVASRLPLLSLQTAHTVRGKARDGLGYVGLGGDVVTQRGVAIRVESGKSVGGVVEYCGALVRYGVAVRSAAK